MVEPSRNTPLGWSLRPARQLGMSWPRVVNVHTLSTCQHSTNGAGGIRTLGAVTRTPHFQCGPLSRSDTAPKHKRIGKRRGNRLPPRPPIRHQSSVDRADRSTPRTPDRTAPGRDRGLPQHRRRVRQVVTWQVGLDEVERAENEDISWKYDSVDYHASHSCQESSGNAVQGP